MARDPLITWFKQNLTIPAAGNTVIFEPEDAEDIGAVRIYVKNTGSNALDAAVLEITFDKGTTFVTIEASAITTAFGTLAAGVAATLVVQDVFAPRARFTLSAAAGGTIVDVGFVVSEL